MTLRTSFVCMLFHPASSEPDCDLPSTRPPNLNSPPIPPSRNLPIRRSQGTDARPGQAVRGVRMMSSDDSKIKELVRSCPLLRCTHPGHDLFLAMSSEKGGKGGICDVQSRIRV